MARYRIVPDRSTVTIDARSNVHPIHSATTGLEGWVDLDLGPGGAVDVGAGPGGALQLAVERLRSGNRLEDREMQRRIDARRYPTISGELRGLTPEGPDGAYRATGTITFRGVDREAEDVLTIRPVDDRTVTLSGRSRFDIRHFGMDPPRILVLRVEPEVDVGVEITATREE